MPVEHEERTPADIKRIKMFGDTDQRLKERIQFEHDEEIIQLKDLHLTQIKAHQEDYQGLMSKFVKAEMKYREQITDIDDVWEKKISTMES